MLGPLARISNHAGRNLMKNIVRNGSHGGVPGENLPFNIHNRARFTLNFFLFGATGFGIPYVILAWQVKK